jgi:hypothetical protein
MESSTSDEVEMRSQFTGPLSVDLNCGRYCTEAAIKWWAHRLGLELGDVFHKLLPEPVYMIGWSPGREGKDLTVCLSKPATLGIWKAAIGRYGPLIVSGSLGEVSSRLGFYVGHFILIVDVEMSANELVCKDPLKGNKTISYPFEWISKRIETVYAVDPGKLQLVWQKHLKATQEAETQRMMDAFVKLSPHNTAQERDDLWNDML